MINCYAFDAVPPFAQGLVRDLRVRWALEEAGLPYRVTLLPDDPYARAHVIQWMFAALNTIEFPIMQLAGIDLFHPDEPWATERRPAAVQSVRRRLAELAACLDGREHLVGSFSAADVLMTSVLRILRHTDLVEEEPVLLAYKERCEARPAFAKALAGQMVAFGPRGRNAEASAP